jgi:hypothetical protein
MASGGCLCQLLSQLTDEDIDDLVLRLVPAGICAPVIRSAMTVSER